jgi:ketosteroid isomerase-like protein
VLLVVRLTRRDVSADDLDVARQFLTALAAAARTGERDPLYPLLVSDVEWVTPQRKLAGIDDVRAELTWLSPPEHLDLEFEEVETTDLGDGQIVTEVHEIYRMKQSGEFAYARDRRITLTIRDRKVARYELRNVG